MKIYLSFTAKCPLTLRITNSYLLVLLSFQHNFN